MLSVPLSIEIVSFTGDSGLADYSVSLARALAAVSKNSAEKNVTAENIATSVTVVTATSLPQRFDSMGFSVERVFRRSRHYPVDILRFLWGVLRRRPDWVILQGPLKFALLDGLIVRVLRLAGIHCAITVHDVLPHYPKPWSVFTFGFYYRSFGRVIAHSQAAEAGLRQLGVHQPLLIVPHGIYDIFNLTQLDRESARKLLGRENDVSTWVLFFGHLEPRKGLMEFLSAAERLVEDRNFTFVLAGGNSLAGHHNDYAQRLEAARRWPNVLLCDQRIAFEAVEQYFAASDIVALPYLEGTTSGVLKLALAFGKPVVASEVGDFPEQIPAGAGILFPADNRICDHLVDAIKDINANLPSYSHAMQASCGSAQWPDIAVRVLHFLKVEC